MPCNCAVKSCNLIVAGGGVFRFPTDLKMRQAWLESLDMAGECQDRISSRAVCFRHFRLEDFKMNAERMSLNPKAVPSPEILTEVHPKLVLQCEKSKRAERTHYLAMKLGKKCPTFRKFEKIIWNYFFRNGRQG